MSPRDTVALVVARAPVPGQAKTRLARTVGDEAAAELAAAALLDTLDACEAAFGAGRSHLALHGSLAEAVRGREIRERLDAWTVHGQHGADLGERIAQAHDDVARASGRAVVQVGADTPQLTADDLCAVAGLVGPREAALGPAYDGGWWVLGLADPGPAAALAGVPMSTPRTCWETETALRRAGVRVARARVLRDVDTADDAAAVAAEAPGTRFAAAWAALDGRIC